MERKALALEIKDAATGAIEARFATLNVKDFHGDLTLPGAFEDGAEVPITHYGHQTYVAGKLPIGVGMLHELAGEVRLKGQLFIDETQDARDHFAVMKRLGSLQQWSYEYDIAKTGTVTPEMREQGVRRVLERVKVFGVSPVLVGAGVDTQTLALNQADLVLESGNPYDLVQRGTLFCVVKRDSGETVKCHETHDEAMDHFHALEAAVADEMAKAAQIDAAAKEAADAAVLEQVRREVTRFERTRRRLGL